MTNEQIEAIFIEYIKKHDGINNCFGHFKFNTSDRIGQGGNGIVYSATIEDKCVAIKFLTTDSNKKYLRFKSEFFNTNYVKNKLINIANLIQYDELKLTDKLSIPYIIMSKYEKNLKKYRDTIDTVNIDEFKALKQFLFGSIKSLHDNGILHRDIKPENILIDLNGKYYLSDFGIAHFDNNEFPIDNKTNKGERLANIEFSAPEQINNSFPATKATDIYSVAQVLYWFMFKTANRGTGGEHISTVFKEEDSYIYDNIIYKCINNNPLERFQSIDEINDYYNKEIDTRKEINPFDDMYQFRNAICSVFPEFCNQVYYIENKNEMENLFNTIFTKKYNKHIEFNSGNGNNTISSIIKLENDEFLMDYRQINIIRVWELLTNDVYDDIILLELGESKPYIINDKEYYGVAQINDNEIVPIKSVESGFVRYKNNVISTQDLKIQERYIFNDYKIIVLAPFHSCSIIKKNDNFICEMQSSSSIVADDIFKLKKQIHMNRARDVEFRL